MEALDDPSQLVAGPKVEACEYIVAELFGMRYGVMVNSGSSANLLALSVLDLPPNARIATPACTFGTTVAPILQLGHTPVFVDIERDTYQIDVQQMPDDVDAYLIPRLLGNVPDEEYIYHEADGRPVVVDACDTLGPCVIGDIVTTSFYASHIVTAAGGGGMLCFGDRAVADQARLLSRWGRESTLVDTDDIKQRFRGGYDAKFTFTGVGYNMQPLELQGAFLLEQLNLVKIATRLQRRREQFQQLLDFFSRFDHWFVTPKSYAEVYWLAFPLTIGRTAPFTRYQLVGWLEGEGIQTRPIMAGNILRHPAFRHLGRPEDFPVADEVYRDGLLVGCHQNLTDQDMDYLITAFCGFLRRYE